MKDDNKKPKPRILNANDSLSFLAAVRRLLKEPRGSWLYLTSEDPLPPPTNETIQA